MESNDKDGHAVFLSEAIRGNTVEYRNTGKIDDLIATVTRKNLVVPGHGASGLAMLVTSDQSFQARTKEEVNLNIQLRKHNHRAIRFVS